MLIESPLNLLQLQNALNNMSGLNFTISRPSQIEIFTNCCEFMKESTMSSEDLSLKFTVQKVVLNSGCFCNRHLES